MPSTTKPVVLIIPGAWHPASCAEPYIKSLQLLGYSAQGVDLRSVGDASVCVQDDVDHVQSVMKPLVDDGKDLVLVVHSYGGFVGTGAIAGLDKRAREAQGLRGGVLGIVFLAAFIPAEGNSIYGMLGEQWLWWMTDKTETGFIETHHESEVFFNDCTEEVIKAVLPTLRPQSTKAMKTSPAAIGWRDAAYDGRRAYIRCLRDKALLPEIQTAFVEGSGKEWIVKSVDTSHSPFISAPDELARVTKEILEEFEA